MKYLFFDIECCNGRNICEFGYVLADESFRIVDKRNFIIDPQEEFNLPPRSKKNPFRLSYSESEYRNSPDFTFYYQQIRDLLCDPEHTVVGYSILNDITFLRVACTKYGLDSMDFQFYDIQKLYGCYLKKRDQISLKTAAEELGISLEEITLHNGCCDSELTMLVSRQLTVITGKTLPELIGQFPFCAGKVKAYHGHFDAQKAQRQYIASVTPARQKQKSVISPQQRISRAIQLAKPNAGFPQTLKGKRICVGQQFEQRYTERCISLIQLIKDYGGIYTGKVSDCNIFIRVDILDKKGDVIPSPSLTAALKKKKRRRKSISLHTLESFMELLSLTTDDLDSVRLSDDLRPKDGLADKTLDYLLTVPHGKVVTYGQIAEHLGNKNLARAVGNILHKNPDGDKYPCYKVVSSQGKLSESYVFGGIAAQTQRLERDGIRVTNGKVDLKKYKFTEK